MPFTPGQDLSIGAAEWNDLLVMRQQWLGMGRNPLLPQKPNVLGGPGWCWIKNNTNAALAFGAVLGIGDPIIEPTDNESEKFNGVRWKGETPSTSTPHYGQYAVLQEPAGPGAIKRAVMHGITYASLNITHASDIACEISNNVTTYLTTGYVGTSRILWKSSGTGSSNKWGLIRIGDTLDNFVGKCDGTISANGGTGTVSVWDPAFSGDLEMDVSNCRNHTSQGLVADDKVSGVVIRGIPIIAPLACES